MASPALRELLEVVEVADAPQTVAHRARRLAFALLILALLVAARAVVRHIEGAFPLDGGGGVNAIEYVRLAGLLCLTGAVALGAWITPGWTLARIGWPGDLPAARVLRAVVIAFPIQAMLLATIVLLFGDDLTPEAFRWYLLAGQAVLLIGAALAPGSMTAPLATRWPRERVLLLAAFAFGLTLLLLPAIAWTDYNPDGIEILSLGRSLASRLVPTLPTGGFPGTDLVMFGAAYPIAWLVSVAGLGETAGRLPAIGYAVALAIGVVALAEQETRRRLTTGEFAVLLLGVAAVVLTLAINSAYHPYSTDIASPASIDLLAMLFLLGTLYFVYEGSVAWVAASAALMALTRPTALPVFLLLAGAAFILELDWRSQRFRLALVAVGAAVLVSLVHGVAGSDPSSALARVQYLRFDDWSRLRYLLIPAGVIPVLAWTGWRRMDEWSREIAVVTIGYFAFFYCMAFYALHHFAPAMLLPLVTFWRGNAQRELPSRGRWQAATVLGAILAIAVALPRDFTVYRDARRVASGISYEVGDYTGNHAGVRRAFSGLRALTSLLASPFISDPQATRINEAYSFIHYSTLSGRSQAPAQYVVRDSALPAPDGATSLGSRNSRTLYVRDANQLEKERLNPPGPAPRSRWYDVPRPSLFRNLGHEAGIVQIDLVALARRIVRATIGDR